MEENSKDRGGCCCSKKQPARDAEHPHDGHSHAQESFKSCCSTGGEKSPLLSDAQKLWISFATLAASFAIQFFEIPLPLFPFSDPSWIAVLLCGTPIFKSAISALLEERAITSALLISIAIASSIALQFVTHFAGGGGHGHGMESYIFAAGEISFLMALGEMIEERTVRKARAGISRMLELAPRMARRMDGENMTEIPASEIRVGDILLVRPNDMVPSDGPIVEGSTSVDQSSLTGESVPADKFKGDEILAGTINRSHAVKMRAEKPPTETAIAKLITLVEEAQGRRAPISRAANRWASYIVPAAVSLSILVYFFAYFILSTGGISAFIRAVTILVVFCPCAFTLATPTAVAAALGNAAKRGILIKSGAALEALAKTRVAAFDKTGTLTSAKIRVEEIFASGGDEAALLSLASGAEKYSEHPLAKAIVERARQAGLTPPEARNVKSLVGVGVECEIGGEAVLVCRYDYLDASSLGAQETEFAKRAKDGAYTLIGVRRGEKLAGLISLSDSPREGSKALVEALKNDGITSAMLSGDSFESASSVAKKVGIEKVFAPLKPEGKLETIKALKSEGSVCMIGDGVNDAPALASADCSIAMAALGNDTAIESADICLMGDDIFKLHSLFRLSTSALSTIKMNIGASLAVSFLAIILSAMGLLTPVSGAIWHNAASVLVVLNSARLLGKR